MKEEDKQGLTSNIWMNKFFHKEMVKSAGKLLLQ